jgi:predicted DNA-binding mobile mystery protein A
MGCINIDFLHPKGYYLDMDKRKNKVKKLRRRQLDNLYSQLKPLMNLPLPNGGWIRDIREALGLSPTQFAKLLGIRRQVFQKLEASEEKQTIALATLRRMAEAIDCRVVYAVIPNQSGGLEAILQERALKTATKIVNTVSRTMALEDQSIAKVERERQIRELAEELVGDLDKRLWDSE